MSLGLNVYSGFLNMLMHLHQFLSYIYVHILYVLFRTRVPLTLFEYLIIVERHK